MFLRLSRVIPLLALLSAMPAMTFAQYLQKLHDIDSTQDWGWNVFIQPDNNYFINGLSVGSASINRWSIFNLQVTSDGNTILHKNFFHFDTANLFCGPPGGMLKLSDGYISTFSKQTIYGSYSRSASGLIKYNFIGDTLFSKTYTDTSIYFDNMHCCAVVPSGGFVLGGARGLNTISNYPAFIVRTNDFADTLWTQTYQKYFTEWAVINNIIPLEDGRFVAGAMSTHVADAGPPGHINYYHNSPWFLLLDHNGNVVRDTIYTSLFLNGVNPCGTLYKDNSGGYIHIGNYDSVYHNDPDDVKSFPSYIAHLDTNFRITWITSFSYTNEAGRRQSIALHQLSDSSYLLFGDTYKDHLPFSSGWAARISRTGEIIWSNDYHSDNHNDSYFRGAAQRADGSLVIVGASYNDTLSTWHRLMDMWIVGIDSNGCETMSCALAAPPGLPQGDEVLLYPNPTSGSFTIACPDDGVAELYNMQGQHVAHYAVKKGNTEISLPKNLAAGVYVCRYVPANGGVPVVVRVVYEP